MIHIKEKIATELKKIHLIWKDLVNNRQPDVKNISDVMVRYKAFLIENGNVLRKGAVTFGELENLEAHLNHCYDVSGIREKRILLNDAYVGLLLFLSESMEDLKERMEEESYVPAEHVFYN